MELTHEQIEYVVKVIPQLLIDNDKRSQRRYEQLRKAIDEIVQRPKD